MPSRIHRCWRRYPSITRFSRMCQGAAVLTRRFPSRSQPRNSYKTSVHAGYGVCDCPGWRQHGHCWHLDELIEEEKNMTQDTDDASASAAAERALVAHEGPAPLEVSIPPRSLPTQ